ncbi:hypothetical protein [Sulfitobacter sp. S190]|uniref:head-tail connector protein n=1 Tax=Sulfitobacter sp. S190 TaxID=2867022 RepID=UPI0021A482A1|nr:hypothetical protein [Sulfitobacter sp. S190]UWR21044.1 hypothetical protein K3756_09950 [Sulfitobacter sp. S190]
MLIEETSVPDAALPVEAFKAHMRMGSGFGTQDVQHEVLRGFLRAAMAAIEARTGKALMRRTFRWTLAGWSDATAQSIPVAPVGEIAQLALISRTGMATVVDPAVYWLERDGHSPRIRPTGTALPGPEKGGELRVQLVAGFASDWAGLPGDLQQAVLMLAAHFYEYRHDTALSDGCMPFGVTSLIERFRMMRLGAKP